MVGAENSAPHVSRKILTLGALSSPFPPSPQMVWSLAQHSLEQFCGALFAGRDVMGGVGFVGMTHRQCH